LFTVGLPTLFLTAWARPSPPDRHLLATLGRFVIPAGLITSACGVGVYAYLYTIVSEGFATNRTPAEVVSEFEGYTGLTYGVDADFPEAAATLGAQTGLSTFVSMAAILLILFLEPPARLFASWTRPSPDKRPALLVVLLLAALIGVLGTPVLSDYFGLTGPAAPVVDAVAPALVVWFLLLSAVFRLRLLDRVLGLQTLTR
jgi:cation-transporting ATPase E